MIKAPKWCSDAVPVRVGWKDPRTGEILKVQGFSEEQLAEWHAASQSSEPQPVFLAEEVVEESDVEESQDD
jgi:hypothetical protein